MSNYEGGYYKSKGKPMQNYSNKKKETVEEVQGYPIADLSARGINKETCEKFGVRMTVSEKDGFTPSAIYFGYYDKQGRLSGFKKRDLTLDKNDHGHFSVIGKVGVDCKLFGQHIAEEVQRKRKAVWVVEGEYDCLALYQSAVDSVKGTKFENLIPFVVSLSCGTANAAEATQHNLEFLQSFEKIVLGMDNDEATSKERLKGIKRGKEATEDVAAVLNNSNIYSVQYPQEYKDPNDMLLADEGSLLQKLFAFDSKRYIAEKIITSEAISLEELMQPREEGIHIEAFPKLMEKIHGLRGAELTLLTGPVGCGKSSVTSEIAYCLANAGKRVGMIFLEETYRETLLRMMARKLEISHNRMKDAPLKVTTEDALRDAKEWCNDKFVFFSHFGSIRIEDLMNKIKSLVYQQKCDYILLDHISLCISGLANTDERKMLDVVMTELASFCASNTPRASIIAVCHLNRSIAEDMRPAKGKEDEAFWVNTRKESLRGSAALEQLSWIILGLDTEILPDRTRGRTRISCLKNRPWGFLGACDVFKMNDDTGILENAEFDCGEF